MPLCFCQKNPHGKHTSEKENFIKTRGFSVDLGFHKLNVDVTIWTNMSQNFDAMTDSDAHYKGEFWMWMCDLGILNQPAGGGIPIKASVSRSTLVFS